MVSIKQLVVLAVAGVTYALPAAHHHRYRGQFDDLAVGRKPGMQGYDSPIQPVDTTIVVVPTKPQESDSTPVQTYTPQKTTAAAQQSSGDDDGSSGSGSGSGSSSGGTGYMAIVNEYRSKGGLSPLTQSAKLEANALKTAVDGGGQMVHELNPGSFAQVLAPGNANNFESVYVGGWLCERPNLPGLNGICTSMTKGWSHDGQTGHADILSSTQYKSIGCNLASGIWACDLA